MRVFGAFIQDALNRARRVAPGPGQLGRWTLAIGLAATLFVTAVEPPAQASPASAPPPTERLQWVIKSIHILNDRDGWGDGEMELLAELCGGAQGFDCGEGAASNWADHFDANSGDTRIYERVSPQNGEDYIGRGASEEGGIPVYAGQQYHLFTRMWERDVTNMEDMGDVNVPVDADHGWGLGTSTVRSVRQDGTPGDYTVTYEIRRLALPDLRINSVREIDAGDGHFYCLQMENLGEQPAAPFALSISADKASLRTLAMPGLEVNQTIERCLIRSELPRQRHTLSAQIDEQQVVMEMNETNNTYELIIPADELAGAPPTPGRTLPSVQLTPTPNPGTSNRWPDVVVKSIHVDRQAPDGKIGCKSNLTVVVKNAGNAAAGGFGVQVSVDGGKPATPYQTVAGLEAGKEQEVSFEGVRLEPGEHAITATGDIGDDISESDERNNERTISARCKNGS